MARPKKNATCHTDRPHCAKGLCNSCYRRSKGPASQSLSPQAQANRKVRNRDYQRRLRTEHPEKIAEYRRTRGRESANQSTKKWRRANPEKVKQSTFESQLRKYRLTASQYDALYGQQGGVCRICGGTNNGKRLAVDHCHETGEVRALLCGGCNFAVGWAERRETSALDSLREYVAEAKAIKRRRAA
jgi:hypothetical protein